MIRINLLGVGPPIAKPKAEPTSALRHFLTLAFCLVVGAGIDYGFYFVWNRDVQRLQQELKKEQLRQAELRGVQEQNQRYQQQLQQLQTRINTIQTLQNSKSGPVDFMAALGEVVNRTNDLFLATVTPEGERLSIKGQSTSVESMAVFIASLQRSGSFDDVQLRQYFEDDQENRLAYRFSLDCIYRLPAGTQPVTAQPAAASGAPARRAEK